jgi:hypothetical protein
MIIVLFLIIFTICVIIEYFVLIRVSDYARVINEKMSIRIVYI